MVENMDARTAFEQPYKGHTVILVGEILGFFMVKFISWIAKSIFVSIFWSPLTAQRNSKNHRRFSGEDFVEAVAAQKDENYKCLRADGHWMKTEWRPGVYEML